jgi:hypothetical protein
MARIEGVQPHGPALFLRYVYRTVRRKVGRVIQPIQITAHHPRLLWAVGQMEMGQEAAKSVDTALKALVSIKTAMLVGCPF